MPTSLSVSTDANQYLVTNATLRTVVTELLVVLVAMVFRLHTVMIRAGTPLIVTEP